MKINDLMHDPSNVRTHSDTNIEAIKASLSRFGQQKPIVVNDDNVVVAGNGTLTAARELGWETISVVKTHLNGTEATAYAIADNRTAELAEWDNEALMDVLKSMQDDDSIDHLVTGFTDADINRLVEQSIKEPRDLSNETTFLQVFVDCTSETEQKEVYELLTAEGYKCRVLTL
tara:strand:+ start:2065 stop:2586 length:522 start_codon:yes stop_codon:yes gene_type:complete